MINDYYKINMYWRAISRSPEGFPCWDGEFLVFNERSGATHLLSAFAGRILLQLRRAPLGSLSIAELTPAAHTDPERDLKFQIEDILADLESLALIERI